MQLRGDTGGGVIPWEYRPLAFAVALAASLVIGDFVWIALTEGWLMGLASAAAMTAVFVVIFGIAALGGWWIDRGD